MAYLLLYVFCPSCFMTWISSCQCMCLSLTLHYRRESLCNGHGVTARVLLSPCIAAVNILVHFPVVTRTSICVRCVLLGDLLG